MTLPKSSSKLTLLYVEDEPVTQEAVCALLRRRFPELEIHTAGNGKDGLVRFEELSPDLVITDVKMPQLYGIEMSREIKARSPQTPIIVTSAHSDLSYLIEAIEIGISRYVMKPINKDRLFEAVQICLDGIRLERKVRAQQRHIEKLTCAVEQGPSMVVIFDAAGCVEYVNPRFTEITGYTLDDLVRHPALFLEPVLLSPKGGELWETLKQGGPWHRELQSHKKNGEQYWESVSISAITRGEDEHHFVAVKEDITQRKEAEREIELLNQSLEARARELEEANRDLESFSYTVSHDLRTPLTNINGYCQVILDLYAETLDEQCRGFVQVMLGETLNMNRLIKTLLDFSRVTRKELNRERVDLSQMAFSIATECKLRDPARGVQFEVQPGVSANGDTALLRVVLNNLLVNAFKYTGKKEDAVIEFGVREEGGPIYYVRDNGAGFSMAQADRLFKPFQRLHHQSDFEGTGVGLATVHRIVQRHGGRVWAEAREGAGACFYFTLGEG